jgi:hypothetical protein
MCDLFGRCKDCHGVLGVLRCKPQPVTKKRRRRRKAKVAT